MTFEVKFTDTVTSVAFSLFSVG